MKANFHRYFTSLCLALYCSKPQIAQAIVTQTGRLYKGRSTRYNVECTGLFKGKTLTYNPNCILTKYGAKFENLPSCTIYGGEDQGRGKCPKGMYITNIPKTAVEPTIFQVEAACHHAGYQLADDKSKDCLYAVMSQYNKLGLNISGSNSYGYIYGPAMRIHGQYAMMKKSGGYVYVGSLSAFEWYYPFLCVGYFCEPPVVQNANVIQLGYIYKGKSVKIQIDCKGNFTYHVCQITQNGAQFVGYPSC